MSQESDELLKAANRTTRAVRAIALFLLVEVAFSVLSAGVIGMAYLVGEKGTPVTGILWAGGILGVIGLMLALITGAREFDKSDPARD